MTRLASKQTRNALRSAIRKQYVEDHLATPFTTKVLGMEVTVERICLTDAKEIVAVCARGRSRQRHNIRPAAGRLVMPFQVSLSTLGADKWCALRWGC